MIQLSLNDIATIIGVVFGVSGFTLAILNYLRDNPKIKVSIQWDLAVTENPTYDPKKLWGKVEVVNFGRRPVFLSHAALRVPREYEYPLLLIADSIKGERLAEGDPPKIYLVNQDGMERYAKDWKKIRAEISDSAGKTWRSKKLKRNQKPSWAK